MMSSQGYPQSVGEKGPVDGPGRVRVTVTAPDGANYNNPDSGTPACLPKKRPGTGRAPGHSTSLSWRARRAGPDIGAGSGTKLYIIRATYRANRTIETPTPYHGMGRGHNYI